MSDHDDGLIKPVIQLLKHVEDESGILGVQIAGGFVGQHDRWSRYHRSRQCNPLLFTPRKLQRFMMELVFESEQFEHFTSTLRILSAVTVNALSETQISLGRRVGKRLKR